MHAAYLDYAATTPIRSEVREAMEPYLTETFGNPSSLHAWGRAAAAALEGARAGIAGALGAKPREIWFVRGGTESDNLALLGWVRAQRAAGESPRLCISAIEHNAVREAAESLSRCGEAVVSRLRVGRDGTLDLDPVDAAVEGGPTLVSVMWVNNETALEFPIAEIGRAVRSLGAVMHTDAAQAIGKVPVSAADVDMLSFTGHKIYGPKWTGILFIREGTRVDPLLHGGGQEGGLRPGTQDVAGAVGLATAVRLAVEEQDAERARVEQLRDRLQRGLTGAVDGLRVNAGDAPRAAHVLSIGVDGVTDGQALLAALDLEGVAVSAGSACSSGSSKGSHVIEALYGRFDGRATIRFSFGRATSEKDIDHAVAATAKVVERMRSP